jgi:Fe-Mn family superoxide dismutase
MNIESPAIPYEFAELEPAMSRDTLVFHFLRHQRVCFDRMLPMVRGSELEALPLDELIRVTERNPAQHTLYRYAAEVWNHNLFWHSMRPGGGGAAHGVVGEYIGARFGSYERFAREFKEAAAAQFGSGWLWLVWRAGALEIVLTSNAGTPLVRGDTVRLTCGNTPTTWITRTAALPMSARSSRNWSTGISPIARLRTWP